MSLYVLVSIFVRHYTIMYSFIYVSFIIIFIHIGTEEEDSTQEEGRHQEEGSNKEEGCTQEEDYQEEDHQEEIKCLDEE